MHPEEMTGLSVTKSPYATGRSIGGPRPPEQPLVSELISGLSEMQKRLFGVNDQLASTRNRVFGSMPDAAQSGNSAREVADAQASQARDVLAECLDALARTERLALELSNKL